MSVSKPSIDKCSKLRVRANIKSLNENELKQYIDALKILYADGTIDRYAIFHQTNYLSSHNQPIIFWWHRYFIYAFENELQRINPNLTIPYWDTTEDSKEPHKSVVLSDKYFGGNGEPPFYCVSNSFLSTVDTKLPDGKRRCIKRIFYGSQSDTLSPWNNTQSVLNLIRVSNDSEAFRIGLEDSIHLDVHRGLGSDEPRGDMNSPIAPIDPIFYLHHSNLDRWLYTWQLSKPERFEMINGQQRLLDNSLAPLTNDYILDGYANVSIGTILRIEEDPLCYTYDYLPLDRLQLDQDQNQ
ncbi:uncharacterized protein LOC107369608 isoform X2 [Tetranychus urticae]|uniref:Tyrosinase copper-binding domain-containing protein n=2 Tax=Tetranychus urticae TaxID=32264 RepID=T1L2J4_TETUR|nr:uncharacterized protein LOC107369608 isoform X2 [Tetranychus urticae]